MKDLTKQRDEASFSPDRDAEAVATEAAAKATEAAVKVSVPTGMQRPSRLMQEVDDYVREHGVSVPTGMQRPSRRRQSRTYVSPSCRFSPDRDAEAVAT